MEAMKWRKPARSNSQGNCVECVIAYAEKALEEEYKCLPIPHVLNIAKKEHPEAPHSEVPEEIVNKDSPFDAMKGIDLNGNPGPSAYDAWLVAKYGEREQEILPEDFQ